MSIRLGTRLVRSKNPQQQHCAVPQNNVENQREGYSPCECKGIKCLCRVLGFLRTYWSAIQADRAEGSHGAIRNNSIGDSEASALSAAIRKASGVIEMGAKVYCNCIYVFC